MSSRLASRGDAFGLVLAEAGYFGLPAVSTRVGGIPEVVEDGVTGLLTPPDDPAALAAAISRLQGAPRLRRQLGDAARARVEARFSVDRMAREFEAAYVELASMPAGQLGWVSLLRRSAPYVRLLTAVRRRDGPRYA